MSKPTIINANNNTFSVINPNKFNIQWWGEHLEVADNIIYSIIKNDEAQSNKIYKYRKQDGYYILNNIPPEKIFPGKEDWDVEYSFNRNLFRSEHFKTEHKGLHILFGGCSNTEGVGSNLEDNWSYKLYKDISLTHDTSGYFSIAKGGFGWHQIFLNFKVYVEKFGVPDYYIVLHPNILRNYKWDSDKSIWKYQWINYPDPDKKTWESNHRKTFPDWVAAMSLFISYCKSIGTKFVWSTWDLDEGINISNAGYFNDTFFNSKTVTPKDLERLRPDGQIAKDDINFRDGHPGRIQHELWFEGFKNRLEEIGFYD